jgi:hypothetical protein
MQSIFESKQFESKNKFFIQSNFESKQFLVQSTYFEKNIKTN